MDKEPSRTGGREITGLLLLSFGIIYFLGLISYAPQDISIIKYPPNYPPINLIGPIGAWLAFFTFMVFGITSYLVPFIISGIGVQLALKPQEPVLNKIPWFLMFLISLNCLLEIQPQLWMGSVYELNITSCGGVVGALLGTGLLIKFLGKAGTGIIAGVSIAIALRMLTEVRPYGLRRSLTNLLQRCYAFIREYTWGTITRLRNRESQISYEEKMLVRNVRKLEKEVKTQRAISKPPVIAAAEAELLMPPTSDSAPTKPILRPEKAVVVKQEPPQEKIEAEPAPTVAKIAKKEAKRGESVATARSTNKLATNYKLPDISFLQQPPPRRERETKENFTEKAKLLETTLAEFGIEAKVTNVETGPVVTSYEVLPAAGIRVEKIVGLGNNIALAMKAVSVRVQAPIPGKGVVGIEIPNAKSYVVYLREILESEPWVKNKASLPLALGKDVGGADLVYDLAKMPHLLIAGATGSGKSVCMNSILAGLLMSRAPEHLRLMLVDPKIVEFSFFNELPHLVVPVITDPKKVSLGLRWAINEMEKRYKMFAQVGARNIEAFNQRSKDNNPENIPLQVPYIVIVIDELADLMIVAQAEIENHIARLAQLSRAVGIHMIIATQRPSVNVITGTIKANFPARIAFQVAQKVDSRTILDANGADKLLGKGDMLILPPGASKLVRAQGTMTTDQEIRNIVEFWKQQAPPQYEVAIKEKMEDTANNDLPEQEVDDGMLDTAIEIIRQTRRASTSSLQRRLRIGYTRAARIIDILEEKGIVGPPRGAEAREILIDLDTHLAENHSHGE